VSNNTGAKVFSSHKEFCDEIDYFHHNQKDLFFEIYI
jgi:hypothetical protein